MSKKTVEQKLAEQIAEAVNHNWFEPTILANILVNDNNLYTQDKVMELIIAIVQQQSRKFDTEWVNEQTSAGLMLASHLAEVIETHSPLE